MILPTDDKERKSIDLEFLFKEFPDALVGWAKKMTEGHERYGDGQPAWIREKSPHHIQCMLRHIHDQVQEPDCVDTARAIMCRAAMNLQLAEERQRQKRNATMHIDEPEFDRVQDL